MDPDTRTPERYGAVTVLRAANGGAYPYGNSTLVHGRDETLLIDPSLGLDDPRHEAGVVLLSHGHEDHAAGLGHDRGSVHAHADDVAAVRDLDVMFAGFDTHVDGAAALRASVTGQFDLAARPDATGFADGDVFDLGGRTVTVVHLPGHTPGHCGFLVEPDGFFYVADIDLTSFGPYYGDPGSSLVAFDDSLRRCREVDARWYGTAHQKGVIEGAEEFRRRLDAYRHVITVRDERLLAHLAEPRTLDEIVDHRLVYRPHVEGPHVAMVERLTARRHLARLQAAGAVVEVEPGRHRATTV